MPNAILYCESQLVAKGVPTRGWHADCLPHREAHTQNAVSAEGAKLLVTVANRSGEDAIAEASLPSVELGMADDLVVLNRVGAFAHVRRINDVPSERGREGVVDASEEVFHFVHFVRLVSNC